MCRSFSMSPASRTGCCTSRRIGGFDLVDAEQVRLRADERHQRHHELLADRIDRRVGDLREQLLEVVVERLRPVGQHRQRRVVAHRADRLLAGLRHRRQQELQVFLRVAECLLAIEQRHRRTASAAPGSGISSSRNAAARRSTRGTACALASVSFSSSSSTMRPCFEVDQEHLARLQAPLLDDLRFRNVAARRTSEAITMSRRR